MRRRPDTQRRKDERLAEGAHALRSKKPLTKGPHTASGKTLTKTKVLVVYRIGFIRSGVLSLIEKTTRFVVCGETDYAPSARALLVHHKPELIVVGLKLRGADGIQLIKEFRSLNPAAAILALSEQADAFSAQRVFRAGAHAYLGMEDAAELLRALDEISTGHLYVGGSALPLVLRDFAAGTKNLRSSDISSLSDRELEIFTFIGRGVSVSELANELHVSVKTIETHQMRIKEKLALHGAAELRQRAREWLAKSAVNRIREDSENGTQFAPIATGTVIGGHVYHGH